MNHLLRRQWLEMAALGLLCLGLLSRPQAAAQGFADGARLCVGSLLPALFPFMVVCELLVGMALPKALLRPQARLLGLQSEDTAAALLASWLGGYAVCARLTAQLRVAGRISARDAALLMMLGCCSGPGFVGVISAGCCWAVPHWEHCYMQGSWRPTCWQRGFAFRCCLKRMHTG